VANNGSNNVSVIDTATNTVVTTILAGGGPADTPALAITPDGKYVYATNIYHTVTGVWVIATASNTVVGPINTAGQPVGVAFTPDGAYAYVINETGGTIPGGIPYPGNTVSVIATATNTVVAQIPVTDPIGVAITPDGKDADVTFASDAAVIDTATNTVVATVPVGAAPQGVATFPSMGLPFSAFEANWRSALTKSQTAIPSSFNPNSPRGAPAAGLIRPPIR
jgi:YVTN family beta-propeller protein